MTTRRWLLLAALLLAALVVAYLAGRAHAPTRTVEHVKVERTTRTEWRERSASASSSTASTASTDNRVTTRVITRTAPGPGCPGPARETIVERTESAATARTDAANTVATTRESFGSATGSEKMQSTKITERERPSWAVGLDAHLPVTALTSYRARLERRIIGPAWVGIWADPGPSLGAGIRLEW